MPTYEYACDSCDTTHEVQQRMTDPSLTDCPACGDDGLRKVFTNVGVVFKGSGFYRTDSRDSGKKSTASSSTDSGSSTSTSSGSSSSSPSSSSSSSSSSTGSSSSSPTKAAASS